MRQPHLGTGRCRLEDDLDRARCGWHRTAFGFPSPGEGDSRRRFDRDEVAGRVAVTTDVHPEDAPGSRVQLSIDSHPREPSIRFGEERKDGFRWGFDLPDDG